MRDAKISVRLARRDRRAAQRAAGEPVDPIEAWDVLGDSDLDELTQRHRACVSDYNEEQAHVEIDPDEMVLGVGEFGALVRNLTAARESLVAALTEREVLRAQIEHVRALTQVTLNPRRPDNGDWLRESIAHALQPLPVMDLTPDQIDELFRKAVREALKDENRLQPEQLRKAALASADSRLRSQAIRTFERQCDQCCGMGTARQLEIIREEAARKLAKNAAKRGPEQT